MPAALPSLRFARDCGLCRWSTSYDGESLACDKETETALAYRVGNCDLMGWPMERATECADFADHGDLS